METDLILNDLHLYCPRAEAVIFHREESLREIVKAAPTASLAPAPLARGLNPPAPADIKIVEAATH